MFCLLGFAGILFFFGESLFRRPLGEFFIDRQVMAAVLRDIGALCLLDWDCFSYCSSRDVASMAAHALRPTNYSGVALVRPRLLVPTRTVSMN